MSNYSLLTRSVHQALSLVGTRNRMLRLTWHLATSPATSA